MADRSNFPQMWGEVSLNSPINPHKIAAIFRILEVEFEITYSIVEE
jgi:hypothetical protein